MKKRDKTKKRIYAEIHEMAKSMFDVGAIDKTTMREFDTLCLTEIKEMSPSSIKKIRKDAGISQAVLAKIINVALKMILTIARSTGSVSDPASLLEKL